MCTSKKNNTEFQLEKDLAFMATSTARRLI